MSDGVLPQVRQQYEALPYPPRDPDEESRRLLPTWLDSLPMINHYCFAGQQEFRRGWRVLVAGGGTGDATIHLILKYIDGRRSFAEVFALVRGEEKFRRSPPDDATLFADFAPLYGFLNAIERMLLTRCAR